MSASEWVAVPAREFLADVERARCEPYKLHAHDFQPRKRMPWLVCRGCGLVRLRNRRTAWAERMGCLWRKHPEARARLA
jgi:hypothetical protein